MLKLADRVKETSITVGSGLEIVLAGAFGAFQTFSSTIGDGNSTYYTIENNSNFEVGVGTYNSSGNTLSRDLVLSSTNNNQRISLDGVSIIFCCYPASQAVFLQDGYINALSPQYSGILFPDTTIIDTAFLSGVVPNASLPSGLVYTNDSRLSNSRNPNPHTHPISDIIALQSALDSKQPTGSYAQSIHSHVISDVQNLQATLDNKQAAGSYAASSHTHTSSQITDFAIAVSSVAPPTTNANLLTAGTLSDDRLSNNIVRTSDSRLSDARTPLSHSHNISDVANLQSSLDSKQASGNYASSIHQHLIADVSGLQSVLNNKQASGNYAASTHSHLASDITDFVSAVNTYAPPTIDASLLTTGVLSDSRLSNNVVITTDTRLSNARTPLSHNHNISDVSGLQTALDSKQISGSYAALSHTHAISSISGLQLELDGKQPSGSYAALSHTHTSSNIIDFNASVSGLVSGVYAPINSPTFTGTINGTDLQINRITSNEQIVLQSTGVTQFGSKISKPSINISNIGDSSFTTNSNIIGVQIVTNSNIEQNAAQYSRAFYGENKHLIASGVTNSGNSVAMQFAGMRNFSSSGDAGYLNGLYGIAIQYGHNILDSSVTPQTSNMYGLYIEPYNGYGTVNNSYDIFARPNAYLIEDYGVINNAYGIYIQGSHKKHLLEGKLGIGTNNPSYQLDVIGSGNFSQNLLVNGTPVSVSGHTHTSSQITDFNSSISGLLPVKNIIAGSNVTVSSTSGIYTINSSGGGGGSSSTVRGSISTTGVLSSFNVTGGYSVGYLDLFQNGVKLLAGSDFTATDGTSVTLSNSVPSGTVLEYISLGASLTSTSYNKLDNISSSFNGLSTSFGLAVSGTPYYPVSANTLGIYVGGVAQEPIFAYSVSGSNIVFTEAPASGLTFWGVGYGTTAVATLNGIVPGSSESPAISSSNDLTTGFYFPSSGNISVAGNLGIGTSSPSTLLDVNSNKFRIRNSKTPSSASDIGNQGDICWDSSYIYVCTSTNSWTRSPISAWSSDPYFSNVSLLLHMNGTGSSFFDSSASPKIITAVGAATQSATQSKWGGKSLELNGSTSNLSLSSSGFTLSGDFVIETWIYLSSLAVYGSIIETRSSPSFSDFICGIYNVGGTLRPDFVTAGGGGARLTGSSTSVSLSSWTHVAFVRSGGVISAFINGVRDSTQINYSSTITPTSANMLIGRNVDGNFIDGYIDDLRITVGSDRGYTGSTITVPTAAFPDYNT